MVEDIVDMMIEKLEELDMVENLSMDEKRKVARELVYSVLDFETEQATESSTYEEGEDHWFDEDTGD